MQLADKQLAATQIVNTPPARAQLDGTLDSEEERGARQRTREAATILSGRRGDLPDGFVQTLFGRASAEDVLRYEAAELATLAEAAWEALRQRNPATPEISLASRGGGHRLDAITVVEILNDDMPFLVDSVLAELAEQGLDVHLVAHPVFSVERDAQGRLVGLADSRQGGKSSESLIHIHVDRLDEAQRAALRAGLEQVLREVAAGGCRLAADARLRCRHGGGLQIRAAAAAARRMRRGLAFPRLARGGQFHLPGGARIRLRGRPRRLRPEAGRASSASCASATCKCWRRGNEPVSITPEIRAFLKEPKALIIAKANMRSRVHRRVYMDYIGVKRFAADGSVTGEFRIVGLFTSSAYTRAARAIPYLRLKCDAVLRRAGFDEHSHSGKALVNVLESYPRDDLFQIDEDTLYRFALAIMQLEERPRVRVLARRDRFDRFVSVLVFVPRERYSSAARAAIGSFLADIYKGRVSAFYPFFPEGPLVRVHYIIGRSEGQTPNPERTALEDRVSAITRTWADDLSDALALAHEPSRAQALLARYRGAFHDGYRESYPAAAAVAVIRVIENLTTDRPVDIDFYRRDGDAATSASLKVWSGGRPIPLSERVPVLENMGFRVVDERTYRIVPQAGEARTIWFHDMLLERDDGAAVELGAFAERLEGCFRAVLAGEAENDGFNALVLAAGLPLARRRARPHARPFPAPGPHSLFAGLSLDDAAQARRNRRTAQCAVPYPLRSAA